MSPESAIRYVKIFVSPIMCWPPPLNASKSDLLIQDILFLIAASCPVYFLFPLVDTIRDSRDDITKTTKTLSAMIALSFAIFKMFMCRYRRAEFQIFYAELDEFIKEATGREREILERYMDRCGPLYIVVAISAVLTFLSFSAGPLVLPQVLPVELVFPLSYEDSKTVLVTLYIMEIVMACQAVSAVIVDIEIALIMWYSGIRFELLAEDFMNVTSSSEFNRCIEKHQKLLAFTNRIISNIRYIVFGVAAVTTLGNICTGYQFVHHQPVAVLTQFIFMLAVMSMEVLMYAWPADNLLNASENIAYAVYTSQWYERSPAMLKSMQIVMRRAQKPLLVSIGGFLPRLDLEFYGTYLVTSVSYLTTLQAIVG